MRAKILIAIATVFLAVIAVAQAQMVSNYDLSPASNKKFLADNAVRKGVVVLPSGLQYRVIRQGHGASPLNPMDHVAVSYRGWLINGHVFDQTQLGHPAHFAASGLIRGWVEALRHMHEGDEWELVIPARLAYGADGAGGGVIPPNQTLVFDMELIQVDQAQP